MQPVPAKEKTEFKPAVFHLKLSLSHPSSNGGQIVFIVTLEVIPLDKYFFFFLNRPSDPFNFFVESFP